jgi:hypothetical protein
VGSFSNIDVAPQQLVLIFSTKVGKGHKTEVRFKAVVNPFCKNMGGGNEV